MPWPTKSSTALIGTLSAAALRADREPCTRRNRALLRPRASTENGATCAVPAIGRSYPAIRYCVRGVCVWAWAWARQGNWHRRGGREASRGFGRQRICDNPRRVAHHSNRYALAQLWLLFEWVHVLHHKNRASARPRIDVRVGRVRAVFKHDSVFVRGHVRHRGFKEDAHSSRSSTEAAAGAIAASAQAQEPRRPSRP
jgi:hypothetical protein